ACGQAGAMMDARKKLVRACYDAVAETWGEANRRRIRQDPPDAVRERTWYERFAESLPARARVLDLGCGNGAPHLVDLIARGHRVVGVDLSHEQLRRARSSCPTAPLVEADMAEVAFVDGAFDGIWSLHAIWNLPRQEHAALFARARRWMADGGVALLTMAAVAPEQFVDGPGLFTDLFGAPTFYDTQPAAASLALLRQAGFTIVDVDAPPRGHPLNGVLFVLARASG
ncbi:MAG TPA: class I SAM-dependent methyltransferase, partial [Polyangia bacterium]